MLKWTDVLSLGKAGNPAADRKVVKTDAEWRQQYGRAVPRNPWSSLLHECSGASERRRDVRGRATVDAKDE